MVFEHNPTKGELKFVANEQTSSDTATLSKESSAFLIGLMTPGNEAYARLPEEGGVIQVAPDILPNAVDELLSHVEGAETE